jgi:hypothetical protein
MTRFHTLGLGDFFWWNGWFCEKLDDFKARRVLTRRPIFGGMDSHTAVEPVTLRIDYDPPPIPIRSFDWCVINDDTYDGAPDAGPQEIGHGATKVEALQDFAERAEEMRS